MFNFFFNHFNHDSSEKARLNKFLSNLNELGDIPTDDKRCVGYLIDFYNVVSDFSDGGTKLNAVSNTEEIVKDLYLVLDNSGRDPYGINRSRKGEKATIDNVFLGDVCGLWTFPARTWLADGREKDLATICRYQVRVALRNRKFLIEILEKLLKLY